MVGDMTGIEWLRQLDPKDAAGLLIHAQWFYNKYHLLDPAFPEFDVIYTTTDGKKFVLYEDARRHEIEWLEGEIRGYGDMVAGANRVAADLRKNKKLREKMKGDGRT